MVSLALRNFQSVGPATGPGKPVTDLSDEQALALVNYYYPGGAEYTDKFHFEKQWFRSVTAFLGLQGSSFPSYLIGADINNDPPQRIRYIANMLQPMVVRIQSKMTAQPPAWSVLPKTSDIKDQQAAQVGEKLLYHWERDLDFNAVRQEIALWMLLCGTCLAEPVWNPFARGSKTTYLDPRTGQPFDEQWIGAPEQAQVRELLDKSGWYQTEGIGEFEIRIHSPFSIFVPIMATGFQVDSSPWMVHDDVTPLDSLWNEYGEKAAQVQPMRDNSVRGNFVRRIKSLVSRYGYRTAVERKDKEEIVQKRTLWCPPSAFLPRGRKIVVAGTTVLENVPHPFAELGIRFPVAKFDFCPVPGRFWSKGMVEEMLWPQEEYNKARSELIEGRRVMAKGKWLVNRNSNVTEITNEWGEILEYDNIPPDVKFPQIDPTVHELSRNQALMEMQTIGAQQDPSMGRYPEAGSSKSGIAISLLQEQDDRVVAPATRSLERGMERLGRLLLRLASKYYTERRLIHVYGRGKQQDSFYFLGSDLRENDMAVVIPGSMAPRSKAAEMEKIQRWIEMQPVIATMDPIQRAYVVTSLDLMDADVLTDPITQQLRRARIENEIFSAPTPGMALPMVEPFDNHEVHIPEHTRDMLSDDFEKRPEFLKQAQILHLQKHQMELQAQQMAAMMMQAQVRGGPGQMGAASQPRDRQQTPGSRPEQEAA